MSLLANDAGDRVADHSGFDRRARELMQLKDGAWRLTP